MQFIDAWNFDVRAMKKSCVHNRSAGRSVDTIRGVQPFFIATARGERLEALRREVLAPFATTPSHAARVRTLIES